MSGGRQLIRRRCRATGTYVVLYDRGADDFEDQRWETICEEHGGVCSHETRTLAEAWLSHPDEWCEDCMHGEGTLDGARDVPDLPVEVRVEQTGDTGYAEDEGAALVAARTLIDDANRANPYQGFSATVTFLVDDRVVRSGVRGHDVSVALMDARSHP